MKKKHGAKKHNRNKPRTNQNDKSRQSAPAACQHITRVNRSLVLSLVCVGVGLTVTVHFVHAYQVDRNADSLLARATTAESKGDLQHAMGYLAQYLKSVDEMD